MFDFLGGLFSAGGQVAGAEITANEQAAANQANLQFAQQQATGQNLGAYYGNLKNAAAIMGVNPIMMLPGGAGGAGPGITATSMGQGISGAAQTLGQDISRAVAAMSPHAQKMQYLQEQEAEARLEALRTQNAGQKIENMRRVSAPGSPPARPLKGWPLDVVDTVVHDPTVPKLDDINKKVSQWGGQLHDYLRGQLTNMPAWTYFDPN